MAFEKLFQPIKIRGMELRNRVVMSAMGTGESKESEDGKSVTDKLIAYHVARAAGGCGMNTVEVTSVDKQSAPYGFLSIAEDKYIDGFRKLNDAVHQAGGKTCVQLWQGGLAVAGDPQAEILLPNDTPLTPEYTVPAITAERLLDIVEKYGTAARRAVLAGFDAVEFHCAHNYLPHSMLSGGLNYRTDEWGGSLENREKFPLACIRSIRENLPEDMPLFMRVDCHDDMLEGGLTVEEVIDFCKKAGEAGVDVINVSRGNIMGAANIYEVAPVEIPHCYNVEDAARIRKETGMITMPCGRINTPEMAEEILESDKADMVIMARAQLADPEFCNKAREGRLNEIRYCIGCDQGCYDGFVRAMEDPECKHITCARNPALLEEEAYRLRPAETPKKVFVAGGGIAGMEAAIDLKLTGNEPVLFEKSEKLGGLFTLAGVAPGKEDFRKACEKTALYVTEKGIETRLATELTAEMVEEERPDAVIIATGSDPMNLRIPGADSDIVMQSRDLLAGGEIKGKRAVVIGGGLVGFECAEYLASKGLEVNIIEMKDAILTELGTLRNIAAQFALAELPITVNTEMVCKEIKDGKVYADCKDGAKEFEADMVIMATGALKNDSPEIRETCDRLGIPYYVVGDAKKAPGLVISSVFDAYMAVLDLNKK